MAEPDQMIVKGDKLLHNKYYSCHHDPIPTFYVLFYEYCSAWHRPKAELSNDIQYPPLGTLKTFS